MFIAMLLMLCFLHNKIRYSRTGFLDGIDKYDISAWECLFLPGGDIIMETRPYEVRKYEDSRTRG